MASVRGGEGSGNSGPRAELFRGRGWARRRRSLAGGHRRELDVVAKRDGILHAPEDLARASRAGDGQVAEVEEPTGEALRDPDGFDPRDEQLRRVAGNEPHLENEPDRGDGELGCLHLDIVNERPEQAGHGDRSAEVRQRRPPPAQRPR